MTATPDLGTDVEFDALIQGMNEPDPRCEFTNECPVHGAEPCEYRARWVALLRCRHVEGCEPHQVLACDPCHDEILDNGNETLDSIVLEWRPL